MKSPRASLGSRYSVAFILGLSCLMILMASAVSVSPNSSLGSSSVTSTARADAVAATPKGEGLDMASSPLLPFAGPTITAIKTASPAGPVNPGDTITYTVVISNAAGAMDATAVNFADTIDPNTTFVAGSILVSPIAVDDTYNTIGNVNISVPAATGLLVNDLNPGGMGALGFTLINATPFVSGTPVATTHGSVTVNTDGSFTYNPTAGFTGPSDSFTYTLGNGTGKTDTATVTINISGMIWFVNNDPAAPGSAPGDGRLSNPFRSFGGASSFNTIATDAAGDAIFIYTGTADYTGGVTLLANQKLIGQGAGASILTITGYSTPSGANLLPATGGTNPTISASTANITLGSGNTVRGVTLNGTAAAASNLTGSSFGTLTLAETTISGTGQALNLTTGTLSGPVSSTAAFTGISSTSSSTTGISLTSVGGTMSSGSTTITTPTGAGISVNTSSAALSFNSTTAVTNSGGTAVNLTTNTGTLTFGTLNITNTTSNKAGLNAVDNTNTITTTSGTINTGSGTAVSITKSSGTTPLAISLTSVSANGGTRGILLSNTTGSFTVTGSGTANSGGTIQNLTGADDSGTTPVGTAVALNNATNISLTRMHLSNQSNYGIRGTSVTGFTLDNSLIDGTNGSDNPTSASTPFNEGSINFDNLAGSATISNTSISGGISNNVRIDNTSATLNRITFTSDTIGTNSVTNGNKGIALESENTGVVKATVQSTTFTAAEGDLFGFNINAASGAADDLIFNNNTLSNNHPAIATGGGGVSILSNGTKDFTFHIANNTFRDAVGIGVLLVKSTGAASFSGTFDSNTIGVAAVANSGSKEGDGIKVQSAGGGTVTVAITNNFIHQYNNFGIELLTGGGATPQSGIFNATVTGNTIDTPGNTAGTLGLPKNGVHLNGGTVVGDTYSICANISSNSLATSGADAVPPVGGGQDIRVRQRQSTTVRLPGYAGGATDDTAVANFLIAQNPTGGPTAIASHSTGFTTPGGAACTAPTTGPIRDAGIASASMVTDGQSQRSDSGSESTLRAARGEGPNNEDLPKLTPAELNWMVQAAISRWVGTDISAEDLARLQSVTFEIADLPNGELAATIGNRVKIDDTAAGYGWFFDQTPNEDSEFAVPVPDKEFQTTEYSPAHGKMDLLTAVMRELGSVYVQGKNRTPKKLRPLMEGTLSPSVRRLPNPSLVQLAPPQSDVQSAAQPAPSGSGVASSSSSSGGKSTVHTASTLSPLSTTFPLSLGTLPPSESITIMFQVTVNALGTLPVGTNQVCNQGTVSGSNFTSVLTDDPGKPGATDPTCTPLNVADLAVTKSDSPDPVIAGNNITYTVNFVNNGPAAALTTTVTDAVPANTTFVSATVTTGAGWGTAAPAVGGTGNIVFSKASVASGETAVFTIVVKVTNTTPHLTVISNSVTAASTTSDTTPANNTASATTTVTGLADLTLTKTASPTPDVVSGNNITYTLNFANTGPGTAVNVAVTDAVPANTTFVSASVTTGSGWGVVNPAVGGTGNVVFSKASVPSGETAVFSIVVNVAGTVTAGTVITNTGTATADTSDPTPADATSTTMTNVISQADLAVTKTDTPDPVTAGNNITYTINFVNNGPGSAVSTTVTDAVPANTTFVSATVTTGSGWGTSAPAVGGTGNIVFSKSPVANAEIAVFTVVVKVNSNTASGSTITNNAVAASTTSDPTPGNNTGTATTTVNTQADLAVTKSDAPDPVSAGANLTYTINFVNNGPSDAQTVTVTDAVPANTTFVSAVVTTGAGWSTSAPAVGGTGNVVFSKASVAAGETAVFTIAVKVNSNTASGTTISNDATAATATTDPTSGNNTANATTTVQTRADLSVTKSDSPDPVTAGNNITYTINFANTGPSDAQTVTVADAVPANTTFVSAVVSIGAGWAISAPAVGGTGNVVFSKATVVAGETATFTMVVKVGANTANGTTITNSATGASATTDPTPGNNTGTATTTVQAQADLAVTKTDLPDPVFAGSNITYTINFANNGPSDAQTVTLTDATPANTTFVSAAVTTGSGWSTSAPAVGGTGNIVFSKATVATGETAVFTVVVKVNSNTSAGTTITNTAVAASATTDPTPGNNTGTATTAVQAEADLTLTKSDAPDPVIAGNNLTYTINLANNGPSDASSVTVTDAVPANTTFVSATVTTGSGWSTTAPAVGGTGNVVFSKATVVGGETAVFTIVVHVNPNTANGATITNTAVAAATSGDPNPNDNTATSTTAVQTSADLAVTKTDSPDPVIAGNNLTYTINFANNGPSDAQTVTVTDAVPANCTFVSASVTTGTGWGGSTPAVGGTGNVVFSKATVAAGETAVFSIVVRVNSNTANGATITNSATAATATTDPTSGNNTGTATTTVQTQADLAVTKSDSPDPVVAGNDLTYTINFANNGPSDAQTVTVTDAVPANTTFVSATVTTGSGWSTSAPAVGGTGNVVFSKTTVVASETAVFTIVVKVNSNTANGATISNSAVAGSATTDPTPGNNTGTATTTVQTQADLAVVKTDSPDPVVVSQNLTYTINFVNNGPSDAQSVTVTDPMPPNTTFVSASVTTGSGWSTSSPAVGGTGNIVFSKASVAAGQTAVFTIVLNVNLNTPNNTTLSNTATAASTTADPTSGNNSSTTTTLVLAQADLAVTKTDTPDPACVDGNIVYTINFINNGPGPGLSTTVTDAVPGNTTFVSASVTTGSGWSVNTAGPIVFSKASVPSGETAVFQIVVKINAGTVHGTLITNAAVAASTIPDPTPGNNTGMATTTVDPIPPTITCPANITVSTDPNQCSAVVNYPDPTVTDNCPCATGAKIKKNLTAQTFCVPACSPPSGSTFAKGTTTVTCSASDAAGNQSTCSFTITVNDSQPPSITCPANITVKTPKPGDPCVVVNYATPTGSDNCPGVGVVCNPPSGSCFPLGSTTVTCTATDTSGNTATCTFKIKVFDLCVQDDSDPTTVVLINSVTGEYRFCCHGVTYTGVGTMTIRGSFYQLDHNPGDRRVLVKDDESTHKGSGTIQAPPGTTRCTLTDRNTQDNSCACQ